MFMEAPQTLLYFTVGAFVLGWVVAKIGSRFGGSTRARKRDPRDDRIRSLEAELRVAKSDFEKVKNESLGHGRELAEANQIIAARDSSIEEQLQIIAALRKDLKESVQKTRELRSELSDRATENLRSEVRLREVQTELSVAQASTDLLATGVLDYSVSPDSEDEDDDARTAEARP